jgi:hypothetical protein
MARPLFAASGFSGGFRLALRRFLLFLYAELLSAVLMIGLVLPAFVLDYAMVFLLHIRQSRPRVDVPKIRRDDNQRQLAAACSGRLGRFGRLFFECAWRS